MALVALQSILLLFFFAFVSTNSAPQDGAYCEGTGWTPYKDEKCFKLMDQYAPREEAAKICENEWLQQSEHNSPTLVSIKSAEEQEFLSNFIFGTSQVEVNVWLGARRNPTNASQFEWHDGSAVEFSNWLDEGGPTGETERSCVEMQAQYTRKTGGSKFGQIAGAWRDVTCKLGNYVVCQKLQRWSFGKLQQTLLETRKDQVDSSVRLANTQRDLLGTKLDLTNTKNQLEDMNKNPVPLGFIYAQLPNQPEPKTLWPAVQWSDVTREYAGLFFRAEGGDSKVFEAGVQDGNAPRVTEANIAYHKFQSAIWNQITFNVGGWSSSGIGLFSGDRTTEYGWTHNFYQSGGEVRPKNTAMRIWKRIN